MHLSSFILENSEDIAQDWQDFAATYLPEAKSMDKAQLRDHLAGILKTIAADLSRSRRTAVNIVYPAFKVNSGVVH